MALQRGEAEAGPAPPVRRRGAAGLWLWLVFWLALWAVLWIGAARAGEIDSAILIQDSPLAGFQFHAGKTVWKELRVCDALALVREPDNPYDVRAVRVDWRGRKLGYVPRRENADVARLLDRGAPLTARISRLTSSRNPWERVRFEVLAPVGEGAR